MSKISNFGSNNNLWGAFWVGHWIANMKIKFGKMERSVLFVVFKKDNYVNVKVIHLVSFFYWSGQSKFDLALALTKKAIRRVGTHSLLSGQYRVYIRARGGLFAPPFNIIPLTSQHPSYARLTAFHYKNQPFPCAPMRTTNHVRNSPTNQHSIGYFATGLNADWCLIGFCLFKEIESLRSREQQQISIKDQGGACSLVPTTS